jgi:hypothetical protein
MRQWLTITNEQNNGALVNIAGFAPALDSATNDQGSDVSSHVTMNRGLIPGVLVVDYDPVTYGDAYVYIDLGASNDPSTGQPLSQGDRYQQVVFRRGAAYPDGIADLYGMQPPTLISVGDTAFTISAQGIYGGYLYFSDGVETYIWFSEGSWVAGASLGGTVAFDANTSGLNGLIGAWGNGVTVQASSGPLGTWTMNAQGAIVAVPLASLPTDATITAESQTAAAAAIAAAGLATAAGQSTIESAVSTLATALGTDVATIVTTLAIIVSRLSTTPIQALNLVQPGGAIQIEQFASYKAERNNALPIAVNVPVDLTGADVHLWIAPQQNGTPVMPPKIDVPDCTVIGPPTAATGLSADISSAQTGELTNYAPKAYAWCFVAYYTASGDQVPLTAWSDCTVAPGVALTS